MDDHKKYLIASIAGCFVIFLLGILLGLAIAYILGLHAIEIVGQSFKVESMNVTVAINQSALIEAIQQYKNESIEIALNRS